MRFCVSFDSGPFDSDSCPAPFVDAPFAWYVNVVVPAPSAREVRRGYHAGRQRHDAARDQALTGLGWTVLHVEEHRIPATHPLAS